MCKRLVRSYSWRGDRSGRKAKAAASEKFPGANAPTVKMGKAGGAVIQPGRSSAPGKKSTR